MSSNNKEMIFVKNQKRQTAFVESDIVPLIIIVSKKSHQIW